MARNFSRRGVLAGTGAVATGGLAGCTDLFGGGGGGDGEIDLWHAMGGSNEEAINAIVDDFEDAEVNAEYQSSYEDVLNNMFSAIESGDVPDTAQIDSLHAQQILDTEAMMSVEEILPDDFDTDDFLDPVIDFFVVDEELYSIPFNNSNAILYYNADAFDEAGLDPDSPPETLEEVTEYSRELVDAGATESGITWPNHIWMIETWYALADELLFDEENGRSGQATTINVDTEFAVDLWTWWRDMYEEDLYVDAGVEAWGEADSAFLSGEAGMLLTSTASVGAVPEAAEEEEGFEARTGFYPAMDDWTGVPIGGASFWVPEDATDQELLGELLAYMASTDVQAQWHQDSGYYPIRQAAVDQLEEDGYYDDNPNHRTALDQLLESETTPATRRALIGPAREVQLNVEETSVSIFSGEVDVEEGLEDIQSKVEEELERYSEVGPDSE